MKYANTLSDIVLIHHKIPMGLKKEHNCICNKSLHIFYENKTQRLVFPLMLFGEAWVKCYLNDQVKIFSKTYSLKGSESLRVDFSCLKQTFFFWK